MSRYLYQTTNHYFGQLASGTEECGMEELKELGASHIKKGYRGVYFCADPRTVYGIVYRTRIFSRILAKRGSSSILLMPAKVPM